MAQSVDENPNLLAARLQEKATRLAPDEPRVSRARSVAVSRPVPGTRLVPLEPGHPTVRVHGDEVERAVDPAVDVRHVDVERNLVAQRRECLVLLPGIVHQVHPRALVPPEGRLGPELLLDGVSARRDAHFLLVVDALERAPLRATLGRVALVGLPDVAYVAAAEAVLDVEPAQVGVQRDAGLDGGAGARRGAPLPGELGVDLRDEGAYLLRLGDGGQQGGDEEVTHLVSLEVQR